MTPSRDPSVSCRSPADRSRFGTGGIVVLRWRVPSIEDTGSDGPGSLPSRRRADSELARDRRIPQRRWGTVRAICSTYIRSTDAALNPSMPTSEEIQPKLAKVLSTISSTVRFGLSPAEEAPERSADLVAD